MTGLAGPNAPYWLAEWLWQWVWFAGSSISAGAGRRAWEPGPWGGLPQPVLLDALPVWRESTYLRASSAPESIIHYMAKKWLMSDGLHISPWLKVIIISNEELKRLHRAKTNDCNPKYTILFHCNEDAANGAHEELHQTHAKTSTP